MSAIKLPVRVRGDNGVIVDSGGDTVCVAVHEDGMHSLESVAESRDARAAEIVAALNRAAALAALEAVAREALEDAQEETQDLYPELDDKLFRGCSKGDVRATRQAIGRAESRQVRIKAALALAGAALDEKDGKP